MDHKLVCWGDYAIPVPNDAKWLAFDKNGRAWAFSREPEPRICFWGSYGKNYEITPFVIAQPPEPGPWDTQLYWIGD